VDDLSEKSLLLSSPSLEPPDELTKNLEEEERDEADRKSATGFNTFDAANKNICYWFRVFFSFHFLKGGGGGGEGGITNQFISSAWQCQTTAAENDV